MQKYSEAFLQTKSWLKRADGWVCFGCKNASEYFCILNFGLFGRWPHKFLPKLTKPRRKSRHRVIRSLPARYLLHLPYTGVRLTEKETEKERVVVDVEMDE